MAWGEILCTQHKRKIRKGSGKWGEDLDHTKNKWSPHIKNVNVTRQRSVLTRTQDDTAKQGGQIPGRLCSRVLDTQREGVEGATDGSLVVKWRGNKELFPKVYTESRNKQERRKHQLQAAVWKQAFPWSWRIKGYLNWSYPRSQSWDKDARAGSLCEKRRRCQ